MDIKLSLLEAAPFLGISPHTLRVWVRDRRIAFHRMGRRIVFDRGDLEQYFRQHRVPPARSQRG
jgi:excisionase family DNA binding protein